MGGPVGVVTAGELHGRGPDRAGRFIAPAAKLRSLGWALGAFGGGTYGARPGVL